MEFTMPNQSQTSKNAQKPAVLSLQEAQQQYDEGSLTQAEYDEIMAIHNPGHVPFKD